MATITWPSTLPKASVSGYQRKRGDGRVITKPEQGPRRIRKRFENVPDEYSLSFVMNLQQLAIWNDLWDDDLNGGVNYLTVPVIENGVESNVTVQIIEVSPETPIRGRLFRVSMQVEAV
mgnify:CR=1 FL=1